MTTDLDPKLVKRIKDLTFEYTDKPQPELLIAIPSGRAKGTIVTHQAPEVSSLCPLNLHQPDFVILTFTIVPDEWLVELKSLKYYLTSFRQVQIFHEQLVPMAKQDLVDLIKPKALNVTGQYATRGGISTAVVATYDPDRLF